MFNTIDEFKLYWVMYYFPCHDHKMERRGDATQEYWMVGGNMSDMDSAIRRS